MPLSPQNHDPLLHVRGLAFARNDEPVFGPLDFALDRGETLLVEGDNGSGKTTLLRVLAGMLPASGGEIRFDGRAIARDAIAGRMVFLGHHPGMKHDLSPCENLAFLSGLYGTREGANIESALARVDLGVYAHTPLRLLSAGQKKRAALAKLDLLPGELWLLDEPYANLDRHGIELVNALIAAHCARGGATLLTSHGAVRFADPNARHVRLELAA
ncbi:MAG TPA: heme ABC exporter ATP-binding protein CcmA [Rhodanobacteraceae bacterium]|nr:heme ABC exporter ATP-binding protein CcmA [Rhodanobacteraceae bacterium]